MVSEPFADGTTQIRSSIHTYVHLVREPFASGSQTIRHACVYEALHSAMRHSVDAPLDNYEDYIEKLGIFYRIHSFLSNLSVFFIYSPRVK